MNKKNNMRTTKKRREIERQRRMMMKKKKKREGRRRNKPRSRQGLPARCFVGAKEGQDALCCPESFSPSCSSS